ncbi:MAG: hypothetical protein WBB07_14835 [Mycobacterium sp.]
MRTTRNTSRNGNVARYIAAPLIGIGVLGGATLTLAGPAVATTGEPGTSLTVTVPVPLPAA